MTARRRLGDRDYRLESVQARGDWVVVAFSWSDKDGQRHDWAQALRLKHGKIVDMQDFGNPRSAFVLTRLRSAFG